MYTLSTGKTVCIDPKTGKMSEIVVKDTAHLTLAETEELNRQMLATPLAYRG
jgi:hypothetical protein